jgi:hypothetical protein
LILLTKFQVPIEKNPANREPAKEVRQHQIAQWRQSMHPCFAYPGHVLKPEGLDGIHRKQGNATLQMQDDGQACFLSVRKFWAILCPILGW